MSRKQGASKSSRRVSTRRSPKRVTRGRSASAASPRAALRRSSSPTRKAVVLGKGEHIYEVVEGWGKLPARVKYGYTHGVQVDSAERVIIHNQSCDAVIIFDREGRFIKSWGPEFAGGAHGCHLSKEDGAEYLYLSDYVRHIVVKTTLDGEVIWTLGYPKEANIYQSKEEFKPTNVAVAPNGDFYVADGYGLSWIHQYNARAEYIRSWGGKGSAPGQLDCPHGIWVDTRTDTPVVIVADRSNRRLQLFTLDGRHLGFASDGLRLPCHFDQRQDELLVPDLHGVVTILDAENKPVVHLGDNPSVWDVKGWPNLPRKTWQVGKFISPHAACWDASGDIYVVEWTVEGRVTKLRRV